MKLNVFLKIHCTRRLLICFDIQVDSFHLPIYRYNRVVEVRAKPKHPSPNYFIPYHFAPGPSNQQLLISQNILKLRIRRFFFNLKNLEPGQFQQVAKNIEGFCFLILSYFVCNQIWLNYFLDDYHFGYITKSYEAKLEVIRSKSGPFYDSCE